MVYKKNIFFFTFNHYTGKNEIYIPIGSIKKDINLDAEK